MWKFSQTRFEELHTALDRFQPPTPEPLITSPGLATSVLQKSIRRNRLDLAYRAGLSSLESDAERFWRRCDCIVFEDIGAGDLDLLHFADTACGSKRFRQKAGGDWKVASFLIERFCDAPKSRATCDLLLCAEFDPAYAEFRKSAGEIDIRELVDVAASNEPIIKRAIAIRLALGTIRKAPPKHLPLRKGEPGRLFEGLLAAQFSEESVELARGGFRHGGSVLAPMILPLSREAFPDKLTTSDDEFPPEVMIGDIPSWAMDMHTSEGRSAVAQMLASDAPSSCWVKAHLSSPRYPRFYGEVVFRVEGSLLEKRLHWLSAATLRNRFDLDCAGLSPDAMQEIMPLVSSDLPKLNHIRQGLMQNR